MKKQIGLILAVSLIFLMLFSSYASAIEATKTVTAIPTTQNVLVNGTKVDFDAYNIGGSNYFKIRDLAYALKDTTSLFEVSWDESNKSINLKKATPYTVAGGEMLKGVAGRKIVTPSTSKIYVDGEHTKLTVYLINGSSYFRLVDVGQAVGFKVLWDETTKTVNIISYPEAARTSD